MTKLPPAATYRKLALELRTAARAKTDRYAQWRLNEQAEGYEKLAEQIDRAEHSGRTPPGGPEPPA